MKIDAHQHFWVYNAEQYQWINENMTVIRRNFLPEDLAPIFQELSIDGCIAVQAQQTEEETMFLLELAKTYDFIKGVVGWVNLLDDQIADRLGVIASHQKLIGVRHVVQAEPDDHFMLRSDFQNGIKALSSHGLTYDILVFPHQLPAAIKLVEAFPDQPFILDHIAKPYLKTGKIEPWATHIRALAQSPKVWCKVSGIITEAEWHNWSYEQVKPYLAIVAEAFGPRRLVFGSDWPVCLLAGKYKAVYQLAQQFADDFLRGDDRGFWGENAAQFYLNQ